MTPQALRSGLREKQTGADLRHRRVTTVVALSLFLGIGASDVAWAQFGATLGGSPAGIGQATQVDFSGDWGIVRNQDNTEEPRIGDWMGIPLNEAGWARAAAWDPAIDSLPPWQCRPQSWSYVYRALQTMRVSKEIDPVSREVMGFRGGWQFTPEPLIY